VATPATRSRFPTPCTTSPDRQVVACGAPGRGGPHATVACQASRWCVARHTSKWRAGRHICTGPTASSAWS
jgi:hypothetical protein